MTKKQAESLLIIATQNEILRRRVIATLKAEQAQMLKDFNFRLLVLSITR